MNVPVPPAAARSATAAAVALTLGCAATLELREPSDVVPHQVTVEPATYLDRECLKLTLTPDMQAQILGGLPGDQPTFALVPGSFSNGTIEVDVAAEINGKGRSDARGFVGIAFRIKEDLSAFEGIYLRAQNGSANDPPPAAPFNARAIQYFSYPEWKWKRLRDESPGRYEAGAPIALARWTHLRIDVEGSTARAYVGDGAEPVLTVPDLKRGPDAVGAVGIWTDDGTDAYFSQLRIKGR